MISLRAPRPSRATTADPPPSGLADLEEQLLALAAVSEDDHRFVLGQALDTAAALLAAHGRRPGAAA